MSLAIQNTGPMTGRKRIGAAFLAAFILHAGALAALTIWSSHPIESPPGEQEITIDLAPEMALAESLDPLDAAPAVPAPPEVTEVQLPEPIPEPVEEETPSPEEVAETNPPEKTPEPPPVEEKPAVEEKPVEPAPPPEPQMVEALPPPEEVVEPKPAPEPVKPPVRPKIERKDPPKARKPNPRKYVAPSIPRQQQAASSQENTGGAAASADPNVLNRYKAQLAAALRRRLRYPASEERRGNTGIATVSITMQRSGRIVSASLVRSTGNAALDQAALASVAPGTALPSVPDALPQQQLTFTVPLRFDIR